MSDSGNCHRTNRTAFPFLEHILNSISPPKEHDVHSYPANRIIKRNYV
jgi:hypothetical protein